MIEALCGIILLILITESFINRLFKIKEIKDDIVKKEKEAVRKFIELSFKTKVRGFKLDVNKIDKIEKRMSGNILIIIITLLILMYTFLMILPDLKL